MGRKAKYRDEERDEDEEDADDRELADATSDDDAATREVQAFDERMHAACRCVSMRGWGRGDVGPCAVPQESDMKRQRACLPRGSFWGGNKEQVERRVDPS